MSPTLAFRCSHCSAPLEIHHNAGDTGPWLVIHEAGGTTKHACAWRPRPRRHRPVVDPISPARTAANALSDAVLGVAALATRLEDFAGAVDELGRVVRQRARAQALPPDRPAEQEVAAPRRRLTDVLGVE